MIWYIILFCLILFVVTVFYPTKDSFTNCSNENIHQSVYHYCKLDNKVPLQFSSSYQQEQIAIDDAQKKCSESNTCQGFTLLGNDPSIGSVQLYSDMTSMASTSNPQIYTYQKSIRPCHNKIQICFQINVHDTSGDPQSLINPYPLTFQSLDEIRELLLENENYKAIIFTKKQSPSSYLYDGYIYNEKAILKPQLINNSSSHSISYCFFKSTSGTCEVEKGAGNKSPLSLQQIKKWIQGESSYIESTDQMPYQDPMYLKNRSYFHTYKTNKCADKYNNECILGKNMQEQLKLPSTNFIDPENQYYVDKNYYIWSREQDRCCTTGKKFEISSLSPFICNDNTCNDKCSQKNPEKPIYRKDLLQCVDNTCNYPTKESCQHSDYRQTCPNACEGCLVCKNHEYYIKKRFLI